MSGQDVELSPEIKQEIAQITAVLLRAMETMRPGRPWYAGLSEADLDLARQFYPSGHPLRPPGPRVGQESPVVMSSDPLV